MIVVGILEVVVRGNVQLPVVELEAVDGRLLAGLGEGHEVLHLLTLRRLQLILLEQVHIRNQQITSDQITSTSTDINNKNYF